MPCSVCVTQDVMFLFVVMSSHDSMVLVFKCLSNGAVDFLVKPIRKNELKNLWQHVWRRCHSVRVLIWLPVLQKLLCVFFLLMRLLIYQSSGSGSESGIHDKKSVKPERTQGSENDASISDEHSTESGSSGGLSNQDGGSDNGSGTQVICSMAIDNNNV